MDVKGVGIRRVVLCQGGGNPWRRLAPLLYSEPPSITTASEAKICSIGYSKDKNTG